MIIDTHVHYGIVGDHHHPIEDLLAEAAGAGVDKVVQVTNSAAGWNNGPSLEGARQYPDKVLGVIGRFDPQSPDVERRLEECMAPPEMLGIRLQLRGANEGWLRDGVLEPTLAAAEKLGVNVQMYMSFQVPEMHGAARRYPGVQFLIDHMGLRFEAAPDKQSVFRQWPELLKLGEEPNVWIKVSLFPEAVRDLEPFPYATAQRYFRQLYEHLGPKKLIWGSNYPPVTVACTYRQTLEFVRDHCTFLPAADRDAILGGNFLEKFVPRHAAPRRGGAVGH